MPEESRSPGSESDSLLELSDRMTLIAHQMPNFMYVIKRYPQVLPLLLFNNLLQQALLATLEGDSVAQTEIALQVAELNNLAAFAFLTKVGGVDGADSEGTTPAHTAAHEGNLEILRMIPDKHVAFNRKCTAFGNTPLMSAAFSKHRRFEVFQYLLSNGADPSIQNNDGRTALYGVAQEGDSELIRLFHGHGISIDVQDKKGNTALSSAIAAKNIPTITTLCELGANPIIRSEIGTTPLGYALVQTSKYSQRIVEILMSSPGLPPGATVEEYYLSLVQIVKLTIASDKYRHDLQGLLVCAVQSDDADALTLLIERGKVDVNAILDLGDFGYRPLHFAVVEQKLKAVEVLLSVEDIDVDSQDSNGRTALHIAAGCGCTEGARLLVDHGADVSKIDHSGETAMRVARRCNQQGVVSILKPQSAATIPIVQAAGAAEARGAGLTLLDELSAMIEEGQSASSEDPTGVQDPSTRVSAQTAAWSRLSAGLPSQQEFHR